MKLSYLVGRFDRKKHILPHYLFVANILKSATIVCLEILQKKKKSNLKQYIMRNSEAGFQGFCTLPWLKAIIVLQDFLNWQDHFSYFWMIFCAISVIDQRNILTNTQFVSIYNGSIYNSFPGFLNIFLMC